MYCIVGILKPAEYKGIVLTLCRKIQQWKLFKNMEIIKHGITRKTT